MTLPDKGGVLFMMPTLLLSADHPGILYINGRFAGELSGDLPLIRPSAAHGALILDYRPMDDEYRPMVRRLVFSGGVPLTESVETASGINCVIWPGGVIEIEFSPSEYLPGRQAFTRGGFSFILENGQEPKLQCEGRQLCTLPEGARMPELRSLQDGPVLLGECTGGMYLVTGDFRQQSMTGFLCAKEIELQENGRIRTLVAPGDSAGHAAREEWQLSPAGLQLLSCTASWEHGGPRRPRTPEETAIAAVEAALAGLEDEAEEYMLPRLRESNPLKDIAARCDLCVKLKYAPPDNASSVGLLKLEGGNLARVEALKFRAVPSGRSDFPFLLETLDFP